MKAFWWPPVQMGGGLVPAGQHAPLRRFPQPASRCARPWAAIDLSPWGRLLVPASPALVWCPLGNILAARASR
jgi:hypothetical protein